MSRRATVIISLTAALTAVIPAYAQTSADTARVPVVVNAAATVTISPPDNAAGFKPVSKAVAANTPDTLVFPVNPTTSISHSARTQADITPAFTYNRGRVSLKIPRRSYGSAAVSVYSVNGKRVLHAKADATRPDGLNISRKNAAAGIYLLSVKDAEGSAFTTKLTHSGGRLSVNIIFNTNDGIPPSSIKSAKAAAEGGWTISAAATAAGYRNISYAIEPAGGINGTEYIWLPSEKFTVTFVSDGRIVKTVETDSNTSTGGAFPPVPAKYLDDSGVNLIQNGGFGGMDNWTVNRWSGEAANSVSGGTFTVNITSLPDAVHDVQLVQREIPLAWGGQYLLTFDAWAPAAPRDIGVVFELPDEPWDKYYAENVKLGTARQPHSIAFTMGKGTNPDSRFGINFGQAAGYVHVSGVKLQRKSVPDQQGGQTSDKYDFVGWYGNSDTSQFTSSTRVHGNMTVTARWKPNSVIPPPDELVTRTAANPLLKGDFPDWSVIRVDNAYYMVSTTMYFMPVAPIMKSYDLINWRIISYCGEILENRASDRLETESADRIGEYANGQWASSIRYHDGKFWVMLGSRSSGSYLFTTADPENGPWERIKMPNYYHDPSMFFDDDGKAWLLTGYIDISLIEMEPNMSRPRQGGVNRRILTDAGEGVHIYKLNGYYYIFTISWKPGARSVYCYRSRNIDGPFTERLVLDRKSVPGGKGGGVAQGGIVQTPDGDWRGFFFQDRDAVGRVPVLVPMRWVDDWPVFGDANGNIPAEFQIKQVASHEQNYYVSDEFDDTKLKLAWQWNHNPDNNNWSLSARPGYLRLTTGRTSKTIYHARNTLTQRTWEPSCTAVVALAPINMKDGDKAGLAVLQGISGFVGIEQDGSQKYIVMYSGSNEDDYSGSNAMVRREGTRVAFNGDRVYLRAVCRFRPASNPEQASFAYSLDGQTWHNIGVNVNLRWTMTHFTGARFGLFNYAMKEAGGYVDFDYYRVR
ncbi:MAG: family 43 glycosylhydrolase [Chitinispirillales bacterium]|jgi:uncharacterized repeat protein (TIGR02543 family)|nr:family 43 glycosylhydrolase [Chitinispirillales bacterium]